MSLKDHIEELQVKGVTVIKNGMDITFLSKLKNEFQEFWKKLHSEIIKGNFTSVDLKYDWILDRSHFATVKDMAIGGVKGSSVLHLGPGK